MLSEVSENITFIFKNSVVNRTDWNDKTNIYISCHENTIIMYI